MPIVTRPAEIEWKEPPATNRTAASDIILAELKKHPGVWARVGKDMSSTSCSGPWRKQGCEATISRTNPGEKKPKYDLYVRWPVPKIVPAAPARNLGAPAAAQAQANRVHVPGNGYVADRAARGIPANGKPLSDLK
jgi:hypothetical protein